VKIYCILLSLWIVLLSTAACYVDDNCRGDVKTEQSGHPEDSCANCSPFLTCGSCTGFIFNATQFSFQLPVETKNKAIIPFKVSLLQKGFIKIWQPPKLG
jgi:hypothetical protein